MSSWQRGLICILVASLSASLGGCGQVGKEVARYVGKQAKQVLQFTKKGAGQVSDDALANKNFWKTKKSQPAASAVRGAASAAMSAANAFKGAYASSTRCVDKVNRLNANYNLFAPISRVALRIINQRIAENNSRLSEIDAKLAEGSLSDRETNRLQAECNKINQLNERLEAKIDLLTAELG